MADKTIINLTKKDISIIDYKNLIKRSTSILLILALALPAPLPNVKPTILMMLSMYR